MEKIKLDSAVGSEVPINNFISEIPCGRDISDIYLKHPANESSEDEDGTEEPVANGDDEKEEQNFTMFVNEHLTKRTEKAKEFQKK